MMTVSVLRRSLAVLGLVGAATAASAADLSSATNDLPTTKEATPAASPDVFQPFFVKLAFTYVLNTSYSRLWSQNPTQMLNGDFAAFPAGVGATIGNLPTLGFEAGMFVTRNISADVSFGIPGFVDVKTQGYNVMNPILTNGTVLTRIMPAFVPITAVYHFDNFGALRPYLGAGFAPGFSFGSKNAFLTGVHVGDSVGLVLQGGADYMLTRNWGLTVDVKKTFAYVQSTARGLDIDGAMLPANSYQHTHFDPWTFSAGIVYRFDGGQIVPHL
jgi:outer membrane protein